ncbi:MFS general substrate transporter [Massarina eburnea CBS 473.64]|uniref:MFS general substrate transporter n=1 Tax=Massarina eburnea CBS 473.64 TaxID=1395130 RepID=A0A6A6SK12_9PLEO|nr:MFS general substrate transporter [Massarina eburnea CBS 473.64]
MAKTHSTSAGSDEEKASHIAHPPEFDISTDKAPEGGREAWLVSLGGASIFFCCLGFANAYGVFQEYYMTHQLRNYSPDAVAWIGSIASFMQFGGGAIGGPLFDRYGAWTMRPAAIAYLFGMMMLSLCTKYWHFMLVQGVLMGTSMGILQFPTLAAVSQYFDKKRAAAIGIVISGSSIGGIVIPIIINKMLNGSSLGFGWSIRIMGFAILPLIVFSCFTVKARLPPRSSAFFIWAAFKSPTYILLITALFFMFIGMFTPLFFLPTYAVSRGMSVTLASYLLAILNASSTFGRIIPGVLADKYGKLNMFAAGGISCGITILCMNAARSTAGLVVYAIVFGFTSGMIISGGSAAFSICVQDPRDLGTYMGQGLAVGSLAALIGPPVNGVLEKKYGGFLQVSIFSGVFCVVGGVIALLSKMARPQGLFGKV